MGLNHWTNEDEIVDGKKTSVNPGWNGVLEDPAYIIIYLYVVKDVKCWHSRKFWFTFGTTNDYDHAYLSIATTNSESIILIQDRLGFTECLRFFGSHAATASG